MGINKWCLFDIIITILVPGILLWDPVDIKRKLGGRKHRGVSLPVVSGWISSEASWGHAKFISFVYHQPGTEFDNFTATQPTLATVNPILIVETQAVLGFLWFSAHQLCGPTSQLLHISVYKYPCFFLLLFKIMTEKDPPTSVSH